MANPSVTYTFTNGTVADASQVNQNFTDLINGLTDGSKSLNVDAITAAGTATLNGDSVIGNASGDASTVNATMTFAATPKTDAISEKTAAAGVTIDGLLIKDSGIVGRNGSAAVAASYVGEYREAIGSNTALTSDVFSVGGSAGLTLLPGIYDLQVMGRITPATTTTLGNILCLISTTNTDDLTGVDFDRNAYTSYHASIVNGNSDSFRVHTPLWRVVIASNTTYYPKIRAQFAISTCAGSANIFARRVG